jgi:hypothetical protein
VALHQLGAQVLAHEVRRRVVVALQVVEVRGRPRVRVVLCIRATI